MIHNLAADVQAFTSNVFLVQGDRTVLVDAGANFDVVSAISGRVVDLDGVVLTHTHRDHVENVPDVVDAFDVDVWGFDPDSEFVDRAIADGDSIRMGDHDYEALHTPGHKNDHLCFYSPAASVCFAGDLVFQNGSFGRTDLEEGDRETLVESLEYLLETIDDVAVAHVGHGPSITGGATRDVELALRNAKMMR